MFSSKIYLSHGSYIITQKDQIDLRLDNDTEYRFCFSSLTVVQYFLVDLDQQDTFSELKNQKILLLILRIIKFKELKKRLKTKFLFVEY